MHYFGTALELKTVDLGQRVIAGFAAAHSNMDHVDDIIEPSASVKAVMRLKSYGHVGVFIGHNTSGLPMGIPIKIEATPQGLYTETKIKPGPAGDDLLHTAKFFQEHGQPLGMSIGYRTRQSRPDRVEGKLVRRILDYDLGEYSFASPQVTANPKALVTAVKSRRKALSEGSDTAGGALVPADRKEAGARMNRYRIEQAGGKWLVFRDTDNDADADDNLPIGRYDSEAIANAVVAALRKDDEYDDQYDDLPEDAEGDAVNTTVRRVKTMWTQKEQNQLPDSCFMYIEAGGAKDSDGKTVPRELRHFPYKDADGKIDLPHLRNAIARIPQSNAKGLDDAKKAQLQARARMLLERETDTGGKTHDPFAPEWREGAPPAVRSLGYRLVDLSEDIATELKAMTLLGEETKTNLRIRSSLREQLTAVQEEIGKLVTWAAMVERGEDSAAKRAWYEKQFALTEI